MNRSPLRHFPLYQTRDANAACAFLQSYFDSDFEVTDEAPNRGFTVDKAILRDMTLVYSVASFGFRARVAFDGVGEPSACVV